MSQEKKSNEPVPRIKMTAEQEAAYEGFIDLMVQIYKMTANKIDYSKLSCGQERPQVTE